MVPVPVYRRKDAWGKVQRPRAGGGDPAALCSQTWGSACEGCRPGKLAQTLGPPRALLGSHELRMPTRGPRTWTPAQPRSLAGDRHPQGGVFLEPRAGWRPASPGNGHSGPLPKLLQGLPRAFGVEMPPFQASPHQSPCALLTLVQGPPLQTLHLVPPPRLCTPTPSLGLPALALQPAPSAPQLPSEPDCRRPPSLLQALGLEVLPLQPC